VIVGVLWRKGDSLSNGITEVLKYQEREKGAEADKARKIPRKALDLNVFN
jgi:hypothetical protein